MSEHGHSHGGQPCHGHGVRDEEEHAHGHHHAHHPPAHQHGHSHDGQPCHGHGGHDEESEEEEEDHGHGHGGHGHSHGGQPCHGHGGHDEESEEEEEDHGHGHGGHGHSHGGQPCHGHGGHDEEEEWTDEEEESEEEEHGHGHGGHGHSHNGQPCHGHGDPHGGHGHAHAPEMEGMDDLQIALFSLEKKDMHHAIHHASAVVAEDPNAESTLDLLGKLFNSQEDKLSIIDLGKGGFYGKIAIHAWILARVGQRSDALSLLFQIFGASQDDRFLVWALNWLDALHVERTAEKAAGTPVTKFVFPTLQLIQACLPIIERTTGRLGLWPTEMHLLRNASRVLARAEEMDLLEEENATILAIASGIARRTKHLDTAVALAQRAFRLQPSFAAGTALGLAQRYNGNFNAANMAFLAAQEAEPNDTAVEAELGRMRWDQKNYQQALQHFEKATAGGLENDVELDLGMKWLRWKINPADPANKPGEDIANRVGRDVEMGPDDTRLLPMPITGVLCPPEDATYNVVRQMVQSGTVVDAETKVELAVTSLEAPSNIVAAELGLGVKFEQVVIAAGSVPKPDPRRPLVPQLPFMLWLYEGTTPSRAVPAPDARVWEQVAPIAAVEYYLPRYWRMAKPAAKALEGAGIKVTEVAACMIHPPALPEAWKTMPGEYLQQVQVACAFIIARWLEDEEPDFESSLRSMVISMLILGPSDWVCSAVLIAITEVALHNPATCKGIREFLLMHTRAAPKDAYCPWVKTLMACLKRLPGPKQ